jgi:hypothetical protein
MDVFCVVIFASRSMLEDGVKVAEDAELREDDRARGIAVKSLDLAVGDLEYVAAGRIHLLAGRRNRSSWQGKRAQMRSLKSKLNPSTFLSSASW